MAASETFDRRRKLFPSLESGAYLLSHSLGVPPKNVIWVKNAVISSFL